MGAAGLVSTPDSDRDLDWGEERAERLACALDRPVTVAGFLFLLVVLADTATPPESSLSLVWTGVTWVLWSMFVLEFAARMVMAPSATRFLRRNWWQLIFLLVPFLRFLRAFSRTARLARLGSSSVRSTRTASSRLGSRLAWLAALSISVTLLGANLLFELGASASMADALHTAALATVAGVPIVDSTGWARLVEVALVLWSTLGFAALAGSVGAYFLERPAEQSPPA
jgi:voltage-gated potassium channel